MALQEIQFLNENYMVESGVRLGSGARARVSAMLGGSAQPGLSNDFGSAPISNLNGESGSFGIIRIDLGTIRAPDNFFVFIARANGVMDDFGRYVIVPSKTSQTNFQGVTGYELHEVGSQVLGGEDPPDVRMYYYHLPDDAASQQWSVIRIGVGSHDDFALWDTFLGQSVRVRSTISAGLSYQLVDPSLVTYSDSGRQYSVRKPKYYQISGLNLPFVNRHQRTALMQFYELKGVTEPFWVAMDPEDHWDGPSFGPSFGAYRFDGAPAFTHNFLDKFSISLSLREAL